jgi:phosphatidylserine/phosphatidylglycerophosphate/cardiolipin synthase-like enzyme
MKIKKKYLFLVFLLLGFSKILFADNPPLELLSKHGTTEEVEVYFSPKGNCQQEIIDELEKANNTVNIAMYTLTSKKIAKTLENLKGRGIIIRIYLDEGMKKAKYSIADEMQTAGIAVKFENGAGLMHNKFAVIDNKTVITGSFNWTKNAEEKNDENLLVFHNEEIAKLYDDKFEEYWSQKK